MTRNTAAYCRLCWLTSTIPTNAAAPKNGANGMLVPKTSWPMNDLNRDFASKNERTCVQNIVKSIQAFGRYQGYRTLTPKRTFFAISK